VLPGENFKENQGNQSRSLHLRFDPYHDPYFPWIFRLQLNQNFPNLQYGQSLHDSHNLRHLLGAAVLHDQGV
jgi:hypothetical protein